MIKVIENDTWNGLNADRPLAMMMDVHSRGVDKSWLRKSAAVLTDEIATLKPVPGRTFVHLIALGEMEKYGSNRNGDGFPAEALIRRHDTFTKNAKFYRDHKNKPERGDKIYGDVTHSAYNTKMGRVELIIGMDNECNGDLIEKIANEQDLYFSMSCRVPYDICSICNNKAKNSSEYCDHISKHAAEIMSNGKQACMINTDPVFFDISKVYKPADRIAFSLQKVASNGGVILSTDLARYYGMDDDFNMSKSSSIDDLVLLRKLAAMEKEISLEAAGNPTILSIGRALGESTCDVPDISDDGSRFPAILEQLSDAKVTLSLRDFYKLCLGSNIGKIEPQLDEIEDSGHCCPFSSAMLDPQEFISGCDGYEPSSGFLPGKIKRSVESLINSLPLRNGLPLQGKITMITLRKKAGVNRQVKSLTPQAKLLVKEYGRYKFACLRKHREDEKFLRTSLLQNLV